MKNLVQVLPHHQTNFLFWKIVANGAPTDFALFTHKSVAEAEAKKFAIRLGAELQVHNADGTIGYKNSYGNDPFPPRG